MFRGGVCLPNRLEVCERVRLVLELEILIAVDNGLIKAGKAGSLAVGQVRLWLLRLL